MADGFKYDVFISYSRKDYVRDGKPFEGNVISKIMGIFDANEISYWIDKKGIYSGLEFMPEIAKAISSSMMMVFVSSANSNASKFTPGEVIEALNKDRTIIPIRIDATEYHDKFRIVLNSLDYIDYVKNPDAAMTDLLRSVNRVKEVYKKKEQERQKAALVQESIKSIKARTKKYQLLEIQQKTLLEDIIRSNIEIGHKTRICPVCQEELPLEDVFCVNCGWHFHPLEQLCEELDVLDETRLALSKSLWKSEPSVDMTSTVSELKEQIHALERELRSKDVKLSSAMKKASLVDSQTALLQQAQAQVIDLQSKFNTSQNRLNDLQRQVGLLKSQLEKEKAQNLTTTSSGTVSSSGRGRIYTEQQISYVRLEVGKIFDAARVEPQYALFSTSKPSAVDLRKIISKVYSNYQIELSLNEMEKCKSVGDLKQLVIDKIVSK